MPSFFQQIIDFIEAVRVDVLKRSPQNEFSDLLMTLYDAGSASHQILQAPYRYHCGKPASVHYGSQAWSKQLIAEKLGDED
jgi:hypothetical protein